MGSDGSSIIQEQRKSRHEATFVEMLLKPSATRGGKSSGVEEICAQGWLREGGRTSGRHDNLVA